MADERLVIREVAWSQVLPFTTLFSAWSIAVGMRALLFAAIGVLGTSLSWWALDKAFHPADEYVVYPKFTTLDIPKVDEPPPPGITSALSVGVSSWWLNSPIPRVWMEISGPFVSVFRGEPGLKRTAYLLIGGILSVLIWAFAGGAITRIAAVELAREEKLSWGQTMSYVRSKWLAYLAAPLGPLCGVLLLAIPLFLLGLIMRAGGVGVLVGAILWPLVLVAGLAMAALLLGLFFGWPLMFATISSEGTDSFEALSRSYAYTFQRPLRYLAYVVVVGLVGFILWVLVELFADGVLRFSQWAVAWGAGSERLSDILLDRTSGGLSATGGKLIGFWNGIVRLFATAFVFSYFWVSMTAVYFLLRLHVDAAELDEVYLGDTEPFGMPPLSTDAAGVTVVADASMETSTNPSPEG